MSLPSRSTPSMTDERLAAMVRAADVPIIGLNADGSIMSWNGAAERLYGCTAIDAVGRAFAEVCVPTAAQTGREAVQRAASGDTVRFETAHKRKNGPETALSVTLTPVKNEHGSVAFLSAVVNNLPRAARTTARNAARDAQEASPQEFARLVSHDIHAPLSSIFGFAELLVTRYAGQLGDDADEWLGFISASVEKTRSMMRGLTAYSEIDAGEAPTAPVDLKRVLDRALERLDDEISQSNAEITHDELAIVDGHEELLVPLLENLLGNAIKFRSARPLRIRVECAEEGDECVISVRDNGIGLADRDRMRIFQPFCKLHGEKEFPGIGMGLALCSRIVRVHGGRIWAEPQGAKGCVFRFAIPRAIQLRSFTRVSRLGEYAAALRSYQ